MSLLLAGTFAGEGVGQPQHVRIGDRPTCAACVIEVRPYVSLSYGRDDPFLNDPPASVVLDSRARIIVAQGRRGAPLLFDSAGRFVRVIGREGGGPGEYRHASVLLIDSHDTLFVVDRPGARVSVLAPDFTYVRSFTAPLANAAVMLTDGVMVLNADVEDASRLGKPHHVFDRVGNYLRSFSEPSTAILPGQFSGTMRRMTPAAGGGFWSVPVAGSYTLERWSADGTLQMTLVRDAAWFPHARNPRLAYSADQPPSPRIVSISEDDLGRLWVAVRVHDPRWKEAVTFDTRRGGEAAMVARISNPDRANDTIIEVIDGSTGQLLVSQRFDDSWLQFVQPDRILKQSATRDGDVETQLFLLTLRSAR
jgi:hypothetical protein